jgi:regulator of PEP synthase PpsR (kinase-PPPase family)
MVEHSISAPPTRPFHFHLVSDATGETVITVARAAGAQFEGVEAVEHLWSLVRTENQLKRVLASVEANPGIVMFTVVDDDLRTLLQDGCRALDVPCIPLLDLVIATLSGFLGVESRNLPGGQHVMDAQYVDRIEAMNFALTHDDGQSTTTLNDADIVLVGVSRTSKTPTCFYLANRGLRAANVPLVPGCPVPAELETLAKPLVVGLTRGADQLVAIRRNRLRMIGQGEETQYIDPAVVGEEVKDARRLFAKEEWPVIDVTRRSIEETAAAILQLYTRRMDGE